jgi:hypothetical protein
MTPPSAINWDDQLNLRVRLALSGREVPITLRGRDDSARAARQAIARELGIEPIGLVLTVDGQIWADGHAPLALWDPDSGAVVEVVLTLVNSAELLDTVSRRMGLLSHNTGVSLYTDIYPCNFGLSNFEVFEDLRPHFRDLGYIGVARILMLRTSAHLHLMQRTRANRGRVTRADPAPPENDSDTSAAILHELVGDEELWRDLEFVYREAAMQYLWVLHTMGDIDLGNEVWRWEDLQPPAVAR